MDTRNLHMATNFMRIRVHDMRTRMVYDHIHMIMCMFTNRI